jgi:murein DD-endopeptidase MepM/ murein hydrolase activator NlpD
MRRKRKTAKRPRISNPHHPTPITQHPIASPAPWGRFAVDWAAINRWDSEISAAAAEFGVETARLKAHVVIESQGVPDARQINPANGDSWGLMQIVAFGVGWDGWHRLVARLAGIPAGDTGKIIAALQDPSLNLRTGAAILRDLSTTHGDWDRASSAYFLGNPDWQGQDHVNGVTGAAYRRSLHALMAEIAGNEGIELKGGANQQELPSASRLPPPASPDIVAIIVGNQPTDDSFGFKAPTDLPYYDYFEGHGGHANQHTGIDATTTIGQPLYSPISGTVVCAGSDNGPGAWQTGCAGFADTLGHSAGRVEVLAEDGRRSLILGHCSRALVGTGEWVSAGSQVAEAGGMNGAHVHIEARVWDGRDYTIVDPRAAFTDLLGPAYAPRVPIPQPSDQEPFILVTATADGVPVLQRADPAAPEVRAPLRQGEVFEAQYLVYGVDRRWYWVSTLGSRIPVAGTASDDVIPIANQERLMNFARDRTQSQ